MLTKFFMVAKSVPSVFQHVVIDDRWDQLNRSFMVKLMVVMGVVLGIVQRYGTTIECDGFRKFGFRFVQYYCYTQGVYTIAEAYEKPLSNYMPYPGIVLEESAPCREFQLRARGRRIQCPDVETEKRTRIYHTVYQWVPSYFLLCAVAFYLPYILYRHMGFCRVLNVLKVCHIPCTDYEEMKVVTNKASTWLYYRSAAYLRNETSNMYGWFERHNLAFTTIFVKTLYLIMSLTVFLLTVKMFQLGNFLTYGLDWTMTQPEGQNTTNVRDKLFPKAAACEIKRSGRTTAIEEEWGMCILTVNVVNEYLFLIHWYCMVLLIACNCLSLIYSIVRICFVNVGYQRFLSSAFMTPSASLKDMYFTIGVSGRIILHIMADTLPPHITEILINSLTQIMKDGQLIPEKDV